MYRKSAVAFTEVEATFIRENSATPERNDWPLGALRAADRQFGNWASAVLVPGDILDVLLPHHAHGVDLVPPSGLTVREAVERLHLVDRSTECYKRIEQFSSPLTPAIFLSVDPIRHPDYQDYAGLVSRGCRGLTHLDGLHRLIAWSRENKREVPAYVAGLG
jgi:hypothetical protein